MTFKGQCQAACVIFAVLHSPFCQQIVLEIVVTDQTSLNVTVVRFVGEVAVLTNENDENRETKFITRG